MNFPEYVAFTLDRLEEKGYSAYLVGGCVRDYIMGIEPHDFDVTTSASPEEIEECFSDVKTLDIGKKHGTISIVFDKEVVEVTTYRIDGEYKDSRHPESVTFTDRIEDDLARRDFTMNAIAYSPKRGFVDPFDGRGDIENNRIVCVGNPRVRFEEDALRILRALRFSSRLGFFVEENTKRAILEKKNLLLNIAFERVNSEFVGILDGNFSAGIIAEYIEVFRTLIPSLTSVDYPSIDNAKNYSLTVKLCLFFSHFEDSKELETLMKKMKFDNATVKTVTSVVSLFNDYFSKFKNSDIKRAVSKIGVDNTQILYQSLYCHTNNSAHIVALQHLAEFVGEGACMCISALNVKGNEIIDKYKINPSITGKILSNLLNDVIEENIPNDNAVLLEQAKLYIR
ncbi:MAG: CCA tRNA nucleotidyltransferase [Clostridia bacterium]|nr:CCA tRNA nucleotidyltransferase [Clostridia bacterium]